MSIHESITTERVIEATERSMFGTDNPGFCHSCGIDVEGVDPDARNYWCYECHTNEVFGAEETMFMTVA